MRPSISTSTAPLSPVIAPVIATVNPQGVSSLGYAMPRIRNAVPKVAGIVARTTMLILLAIVVHQASALLIEHQEQRTATDAIDDMLRTHVQRMVAGGNPWPRETAESEDDYHDRREQFAHLCGRAGVARAER